MIYKHLISCDHGDVCNQGNSPSLTAGQKSNIGFALMVDMVKLQT